MGYFGSSYFGVSPSSSSSSDVTLVDYFAVDADDADASDAAAIAMATARSGFTSFLAASTDQQRAARNTAAERIDAALVYQGQKYGPAVRNEAQVREFPRLTGRSASSSFIVPRSSINYAEVWDWDLGADAPIVPDQVKLAELHEAEAILSSADAERQRIQNAIASGLASQSVDGVSESYVQTAVTADGRPRLCPEANRIMLKYRITSGSLL